MTSGLVSVVIPVHNRPRLILEAIESVRAQDWPEIEVLIVDDGSTDDTPAALETIARTDGRITVLRQANAGPGAARELGRSAAKGEFIQYLDSDDVLLPGKLTGQIAALRARPACGIAYGRTRYTIDGGREIQLSWKRARHGEETIFPTFLEERWWETSTPLYRRSVCDAAGSWSDLWLEEDWEYDCRFGAMGVRLAFVDSVVAEHRDADRNRLSRDVGETRWRLKQRARAHELMARHARRWGADPTDPSVRSFSRRLFLLSRQCGAAGLVDESRHLFEASISFAEPEAAARDHRVYRMVTSMVGWRAAGVLSSWRDRLRVRHRRSDG